MSCRIVSQWSKKISGNDSRRSENMDIDPADDSRPSEESEEDHGSLGNVGPDMEGMYIDKVGIWATGLQIVFMSAFPTQVCVLCLVNLISCLLCW